MAQKISRSGYGMENPIQSIGDRFHTVTHGIFTFVTLVGNLLDSKYQYTRTDESLLISLKDAAEYADRQEFSRKIVNIMVEVIRARHPEYTEFIGFLYYVGSMCALKELSIKIADRAEVVELEFMPFFSKVYDQPERFKLELPYPPSN